MLIFAAVVLFLVVMLALEMTRGLTLRRLETADDASTLPLVSIVVAARNEERNIEAGVRSLLGQVGVGFELLVVNDRSTDRTSEILERVSGEDPLLRVITVSELPAGWLGKNNALHKAAEDATGEFLLFTDADVIFEPNLVARAVSFAQSHRVDHLTAGPRVISSTVPLAIFVTTFAYFFFQYSRPWRARDPKSSAHVGIGAFNMIRTELYRRVGGHERIRLRPDDDMMLGKLVKMAGGRQELVDAGSAIQVEWYSSVRDAINGLMKNAFTGVRYSVPFLIFSTVMVTLINLVPFAGVLFASGPARLLFGIAALLLLGMIAGIGMKSGGRWWYSLGFPIASMLFIYVLWRSAYVTLRDGGIRWRETFYPLDELKKNRI